MGNNPIKHLLYYTQFMPEPIGDALYGYCHRFLQLDTNEIAKNQRIIFVCDLELVSCNDCIKFHNALKYGTDDMSVDLLIKLYEI